MTRWKETRGKYASHTEMMKALEDAGLEGLGKDVDGIGSVDTSQGRHGTIKTNSVCLCFLIPTVWSNKNSFTNLQLTTTQRIPI